MDTIKMFSAFTGVGSPEMALRNLGIDFKMVGISEVDRYALLSYDAIHNDQTFEVKTVTKEQMLEEFTEKNIAYNFSTYKAEIPRGLDDIRKLYVAHKRSMNYGDITKIDETKLPDFDLFSYSFPCKSISVAGKQEGFLEGSGTQSSLLWECKRIITTKKPQYLLMENVKNLIGENHIEGFKEWINVLDKIGYNSYWKLMNGKDYGVPQNRERVIMISILKEHDTGKFFMPSATDKTKVLTDILEAEVEDKYFLDPKRYSHIKELPNQDISYCIDASYYKGASVDIFINKKRRQLIQIGNADNKEHATTRIYSDEGLSPSLTAMQGGDRQPKIAQAGRIVGRNPDNPKSRESGVPTEQMLEINDNPEISNCLTTVGKDTVVAVASRGRKGGQQLELRKDLISNAITTVQSDSMVSQDFKVRRLTPLECWRLMGFTDEDFKKSQKVLSNTKLYERAGRGIVVPMLEAVFEKLFIPKSTSLFQSNIK